MTTDDDTQLLDALRDMWRRADPPPPGLTATMIAAVVSADLDQEWELLVLVRDSAQEPAAQVRGLATARMLYFTAAEGWSLDAEIDGGQVRGQLLDFDGDMGSVEVTVETTDGQSWTTSLDEVGFFAIEAEPTGSLRFTVRLGGSVSSSVWVAL
ncbi:hypothetical protein SAMN05192575_102198 [Nocardioides alpinus]|uniref:Uncharacterized protein n=1 Tax=Nocardioides alpinus TaxID=748909 RepID=A0A1I0X762_9ACTN|nr:hypothetical protein [Nocardioides alpinus]PKH44175.1 hypothetical protein CXG46_01025 [Nocardioides alpinus]SFA96879.1 hypothetical protein SAMN05192575_102198 [Nocardioides alpinus]